MSLDLLPLREKVPVGRMRGVNHALLTPHPSSLKLRHLLPQGEKEEWSLFSKGDEH